MKFYSLQENNLYSLSLLCDKEYMEVLDELGMIFRLGSKKYYDDYYLRHRIKKTAEGLPASPKRKEEEFTVELAKLRRSFGVSQQDIARSLRTTQSVISRFENSRTNPTFEFIKRYCKALDVVPVIGFKKMSR